MPETITRAHGALTTDAITHANALFYTVPASTKATAYITVSNVDGTNSVEVDVAVDVLGAGTTIRYLLKGVVVQADAALVLPACFLLATDKLRARASANSDAEIYVSIIETT